MGCAVHRIRLSVALDSERLAAREISRSAARKVDVVLLGTPATVQ